MSLRAKAQPQRGNLPEGKTYLRTRLPKTFARGGSAPYRLVIASEGAAEAWQSPGREDLLAYTDEKPFPWGFLHCVRTVVLTPVEMTSWMIDNFKAFPLGARRGGAKHRKNSPQVTVFSQSGEVAMLRAGRWQRRGNLQEGKCRKRTRASQLARGGSPPSEANRLPDEGNRT